MDQVETCPLKWEILRFNLAAKEPEHTQTNFSIKKKLLDGYRDISWT